MKRILTVILLTIINLALLSNTGNAQSTVKQADEQYNLFNYERAAELYLKAFKGDSNLYVATRLANSYRLMRNYENTEVWYAKVSEMDKENPAHALYYAEALRNNGKYAGAKGQFTRYYTLKKDFSKAQLKALSASCDSAIKWMSNPLRIDIESARTFNTERSDWGAVKYNGRVVFTSDRENKTAEEKAKKKPFLRFDTDKVPDTKRYGWTGNDYLRLYQQESDTVQLFPFTAGTDYHMGPVSFTADGSEMYYVLTRVTRDWDKADTTKTFKLEIYSSKKDPATNVWSKQAAFKYNNPDKWSVGDPFISPDGQTIYFVSNMPGGMGGTDIYYCIKDASGVWSKPVNIKEVNSTSNERTPFVDSAGDLYFSSDAITGMGGLDIYRSVKQGNTFGAKQNLRYPINSPRDDFAYTLNKDNTGYLSSNRAGGYGSDDIYSFSQAAVLTIRLEGVVYDKTTRRPLANSVVMLGKNTVRTDATGKYTFGLQPNNDYSLRGEMPAYLSDNQPVTTKGVTSALIKKDLYLSKIELNKAIRIENIYYDYDKSDIRPDAAIELDKIIKILKDNPNIEIELGSHTDSRGNDDYNMALSRRRANSAVDYIVTEGDIDEYRISARGYGETRLLNRCKNGVQCSDAAHQLNRRTEFTILRYTDDDE